MYQLDDPKLIQEADDFLKRATDPLERAQTSLLKAESLFKQKKYAEAGPIYAKLGETDLADDMKTKALYKLGWCQAQTADYAGAIKTYTQYIEKNAGSPTLPSAIAQRGLAYQQNRDYDAALKDFDRIIDTYPSASERELAFQQKALVLGQQKRLQRHDRNVWQASRSLSEDLRRRRRRTSGSAGPPSRIKTTRAPSSVSRPRANWTPAQYGERAALRIILCYYYLQDRPALRRTIAENKGLNIPVEITRWLGRKSFEEGDFSAAEQYLLPVVKECKEC